MINMFFQFTFVKDPSRPLDLKIFIFLYELLCRSSKMVPGPVSFLWASYLNPARCHWLLRCISRELPARDKLPTSQDHAALYGTNRVLPVQFLRP